MSSYHPLPEPIEPDERNPRIQAALAELRELILARYPATTFETYQGEDPDAIWLSAAIDLDELDGVMDLYLGRLTDMQVEEGLPVYVVLGRAPERRQAYAAGARERNRDALAAL